MNTDARAWESPEVYREEATGEAVAELTDNWWGRIARYALYGAALLVPLLFLPFTTPPTLIKQVVISSLAAVAFIAWLGEILLSGQIYYKRSLIDVAFILVLFTLLGSTLFSSESLSGLLSSDAMGEKLVSFVVFGLLYFLSGSVLKKREESATLVGWFMAGGLLIAVLSLLQILAPSWVPIQALAGVQVNTVGTTNALAVLLGFYFVLGLGIFVSQTEKAGRLATVLLSALLVSTFLNLLIINFRFAWVAIAASLIVLMGFKLGFAHASGYRARLEAERGRFSVLFLALAVSIFFILSGVSLVAVTSIPAEISPSYQATLDIAGKTLGNNLWFGSGPGTFGLDYSLYRDPSINQTNFWGVRFNSGSAFLPTMLATTGVLGVSAILLFFFVTIISVFRQVAKEGTGDPILIGATSAVVFGLTLWWLYTSTFALQASLFLMLGVIIARLNEDAPDGARGSWWGIRGQTVGFQTPWATFAVSLGVIFLMVSGISFLYYAAEEYIAAARFNRGVASFSQGDLDVSIEQVNGAAQLARTNDQYYRALAEMLLARVRNIVQQASAAPGTNVVTEFQTNASSAISAGQRATEINSSDALNWATLALVYQSMVPFLSGAETLAIQSYDRALEYDPHNPSYELGKANTYVALADRTQALLSGTGQNQESRAALNAQYAEALMKAKESLERSLALKADYPQANYLLAQVLLRQGDTARAISEVEKVRRLAPLDIGIAFQLGVLYYQSGDLARARAEFERAVGINTNYSNARYFLGLIYDREGAKAKAIAEFEKIEALNPNNTEVKTIISNLRSGKAALAGISPPGPAPDRRVAPPVIDSGQPGGQLP